jgi:dTDP-4-dehydrorhamnose 3,5-epimerase
MPFQRVQLDTPIQGPRLLEPRVFRDARGCFLETYSLRELASLGIQEAFVQDNQSRSSRGTLRGLHFQRLHPQAKLMRVLRGRVFEALVDLRAGSPTEGRWCGVILDDAQRRILYAPVGFAHGFLALSDSVELAYKCSDYYHPEDEGGLRWDAPEVGIAWPLAETGAPTLSPKDAAWPTLGELAFRFPAGGPS